jgi:hypothetical protein
MGIMNKTIMKDLTPKKILEKLKISFKAVFSGEATPEQFLEVFATILFFLLLILSWFIVKQ